MQDQFDVVRRVSFLLRNDGAGGQLANEIYDWYMDADPDSVPREAIALLSEGTRRLPSITLGKALSGALQFALRYDPPTPKQQKAFIACCAEHGLDVSVKKH
jgi:hypothetical protein